MSRALAWLFVLVLVAFGLVVRAAVTSIARPHCIDVRPDVTVCGETAGRYDAIR